MEKEEKKIKIEEMDAEIAAEVSKDLRKISKFYDFKNIVLRGFVTGVFTGVGAIVGVAIFIVIATQIKGFPLIKEFMEVTGLDVVVEYALEQTNSDVEVNDIIGP